MVFLGIVEKDGVTYELVERTSNGKIAILHDNGVLIEDEDFEVIGVVASERVCYDASLDSG